MYYFFITALTGIAVFMCFVMSYLLILDSILIGSIALGLSFVQLFYLYKVSLLIIESMKEDKSH